MTLHAGAMQRPLAVMMRPVQHMVSPEATLLEVARQMREAKAGALLVAEQGRFIGVVSESDLVHKAIAEGMMVDQARVRSVMSAPVITIDIERSAHDASDLMAERGIRHLAVTEEGRIVGMLSVRDLLRYFKNWGAS